MADALIAANGVHSPQRLILQPDKPLIDSGHRVFRTLLDAQHWPRSLNPG